MRLTGAAEIAVKSGGAATFGETVANTLWQDAKAATAAFEAWLNTRDPDYLRDGEMKPALRAAGLVPGLLAELDRLYTSIRQHRDQRGDDRCVQDDYQLYAQLPEGLPEGYKVHLNNPETMLADCVRFVFHRHDLACPYLSPQRRIDFLEGQIKLLREALLKTAGSLHGAACDLIALYQCPTETCQRLVELYRRTDLTARD